MGKMPRLIQVLDRDVVNRAGVCSPIILSSLVSACVEQTNCDKCRHLTLIWPLTYQQPYIGVNFILEAALLLERNHGIMRQGLK